MEWLGFAVLCAAVGLATLTAWTDWRRRVVPNWTVLALVGLWGLSAFLAPWALAAPPLAGLACGCVGLAAGLAFHALGWLGGGDGKLLAAVALWLGPAEVGFGLIAAAALLVPMFVTARWRQAGGLRDGIPFACALAPPAAVLLAARAIEGPA